MELLPQPRERSYDQAYGLLLDGSHTLPLHHDESTFQSTLLERVERGQLQGHNPEQ